MSEQRGEGEVEVEFQPIGRRVRVPAGTLLLDAAHGAGVPVTSACGGIGSCGQCRVTILEGAVTGVRPDEERHLAAAERAAGERLACSVAVLGDVRVHVPPTALAGVQRLQVEADLPDVAADPRASRVPVALDAPTLHDPRGDADRLVDAVCATRNDARRDVTSALARFLPAALRGAGWQGSAYLVDGAVVSFGPGHGNPLGLAVDLGTTKIAALLVDLERGVVVASGAVANPQVRRGDDVVSRLAYALRGPAEAAELAADVRGAVDGLLAGMLATAGADDALLVDACLVGNTAMTHLFAGLPVRQLAAAPFVPAVAGPIDLPAADLGLRSAPGALIHVPGAIGGFVGSDHVAMLLATRLDARSAPALAIDIGTNTEISLWLPERGTIVSVSCASGPAFEGAHIRDGMRAAAGAIDRIAVDGGTIRYTTIDGAPAVGLCGSAIVDAIAELRRAGYLARNGAIVPGTPGARDGERGPEIVVVPAAASGTGRDIAITREDIQEIALAKGAIAGGLEALLEETGTPREAIDEVIVAGAFGTFLDVGSATAAGLFPPLPRARYRQVGNAAATGATWILKSRAERERAEAIRRRATYLELTTYPRFKRLFARAALLPDPAHVPG